VESTGQVVDVEALALQYEFTIVPNQCGGVWVRVPAFPNVFTGGLTPAQAADNAIEAIALALEWYVEKGQTPPTPTLAEGGGR